MGANNFYGFIDQPSRSSAFSDVAKNVLGMLKQQEESKLANIWAPVAKADPVTQKQYFDSLPPDIQAKLKNKGFMVGNVPLTPQQELDRSIATQNNRDVNGISSPSRIPVDGNGAFSPSAMFTAQGSAGMQPFPRMDGITADPNNPAKPQPIPNGPVTPPAPLPLADNQPQSPYGVSAADRALQQGRAYATLHNNQPMPQAQFDLASTSAIQGPSGVLEQNRIAGGQQENASQLATRLQNDAQFRAKFQEDARRFGLEYALKQAETNAQVKYLGAQADFTRSGAKQASMGTFIPMTDQYGNIIGAWNPKTGKYEQPPVAGRKSGVNADEREKAGSAQGMMQDLARLRELAAKNQGAIGPVAGRLTSAASDIVNVGKDKNEMLQLAQSLANRLIYLRSGKQINEQEYARLAKTLPRVNQPTDKFFTNLNRFETEMQQAISRNASVVSSSGSLADSDPLGILK